MTKTVISLLIISSIGIWTIYRVSKITALEAIGLESFLFSSFKKESSSDHQYSIPGKKIRFLKLLNSERKESLHIKKVQPLSRIEATKKMKSLKAQIESVFHPKRAPYFAILTKTIVCPEEFLPRFKESWPLTEDLWMEWVMFANIRQGIGVCDFQSIAFINYKFVKYCPREKAFFEINYFKPHKESLPEGQEKKISLLQSENLLKMDNLISCSKQSQIKNLFPF